MISRRVVMAIMIAVVGVFLTTPCAAQPTIAGMAWNYPGYLYEITSDGDIQWYALRAEGSTADWIRLSFLGNFWESPHDTLDIHGRIVGLEFWGRDLLGESAIGPQLHGMFTVLLDDRRIFQRTAIMDSAGVRLAGELPVELEKLRLPK